MMSSSENMRPNILSRLSREIGDLMKNQIDGVTVTPSEEDITDFIAEIKGPAATPYEGGTFRVKFVFDSDFPNVPPKGIFLTKIFHPNVSKSGEICVNTLKRDWSPNHTIRHVLMVIRCLLIAPYPESALNEDAGKLLLEDYEGYAKHARLLTSLYAMPQKSFESDQNQDNTQSSSNNNNDITNTETQKNIDKKKSTKKSLKRL
eukprot:c11108_g1_i1.p1 GENE.c11108_g1_i1~~c11108_g1_i1.p1  ORF type:complete len:218 (-),score=58.61 c11108_g1_i1:24-635(-)